MRHVAWIAGVLALAWMAGCGGGTEVREDRVTEKTETGAVQPKAPQVSDSGKRMFREALDAYQAQKKVAQFDYEGLLAMFKAAVEEDSKLAEAYYNMGCIYEAMRDFEKAAQTYQKALEIRPDLTLAAANWGSILAHQGKLDQALLVYRKALSKDAKNSAVLLNMAAIYQQQKKLDEALAKASEVLVRDPTNVGAYRIMASVYYDKGDMDMAHLICARGLTVREKDPRLLNTLGLVLLQMKKVPEALAQFRMALEQEPDMITTRFNIAKIALDYKDFRVAKGEFGKILEYEPNNRQASIGLGISLRGAGEFDQAKAHFEALAAKNPKDPVPHYWLGVLALRNFNDNKVASEQFDAFIDLSGPRLSSDHIVYKFKDEIRKGVEMERKVKEMEKQAEEEEKRRVAREQKLAEARKQRLDEEFKKAEQEGGVLPPAKLEGDKLPFVLLPPAVTPNQNTKVQLFGMVFKGVKTVEIGSLKAKWHQLDETTLEMVAPKGLGLGAWDVMVTFKDKSEDPIVFQGGLWVGGKPKQKPQPKKKEEAAKPGTEPSKEPGVSTKGSQEEGKPKDAGEKKKNKDKSKGSGKEAEPQEPQEPVEPGGPG